MTYYPYIGNKLSEDEVGNSTKVLLSKNSVFTGSWEPVDDYGTICVAVAADNPTSGTLTIQTSSDGGQTIFDSKSFAVSNTMSTAPFFWNQVEGHVRVLYSNGSLDQSGFFHLQTRYSNTYPGSELDSRVRELYEGDEYVSQEDAILNTSETSDKIDLNTSRAEVTLNDILEEQRLTNKLLKKIYNPE